MAVAWTTWAAQLHAQICDLALNHALNDTDPVLPVAFESFTLILEGNA